MLFELRVVVWDARDVIAMDTVGGMNDLYISGHLYYRGPKGVQEVVHETDIHWRAKDGKGNFNYRLVFEDLELPMDSTGAADDDLPKFVVRAWDQDIFGSNDLIGSTDRPGAL